MSDSSLFIFTTTTPPSNWSTNPQFSSLSSSSHKSSAPHKYIIVVAALFFPHFFSLAAVHFSHFFTIFFHWPKIIFSCLLACLLFVAALLIGPFFSATVTSLLPALTKTLKWWCPQEFFAVYNFLTLANGERKNSQRTAALADSPSAASFSAFFVLPCYTKVSSAVHQCRCTTVLVQPLYKTVVNRHSTLLGRLFNVSTFFLCLRCPGSSFSSERKKERVLSLLATSKAKAVNVPNCWPRKLLATMLFAQCPRCCFGHGGLSIDLPTHTVSDFELELVPGFFWILLETSLLCPAVLHSLHTN